MSLNLTAYLNQRFQFSYDVTPFAVLYKDLPQAKWRCQIRPSYSSRLVLLDFATLGSPQSIYNTIVYYYADSLITIQCPVKSLVGLAAGTYVFDIVFILPYTDPEIVDGGMITFLPGSTAAGVQGSPAAPPGSDDTVTFGSGSIPTQVPGALTSALASANSSASAAKVKADEAAISEKSAMYWANQSQLFADIAIDAQISAESSAQSAKAGEGLRFSMQKLLVTSTNTLQSLTYPYSGLFSILIAKGVPYMSTGASSAYEINGATVTWTPSNAGGVNLQPGDNVTLAYSYLSPLSSQQIISEILVTGLPNVQRDGPGAEPTSPGIIYINASGFIVVSQ